jgi:lipoprotein signal peptidase
VARRWPWILAAAVAALDRATKHWIETRVAEWESIPVIDGLFRIVHTRNTGVAFSLFAEQGAGTGQAVLTALVSALAVLVAVLLWRACRDPREPWPVTAALAAFNVADSAISCGAVLLLVNVWRGRARSRPAV